MVSIRSGAIQAPNNESNVMFTKNEILKSFVSGKLRKNAKKIIQQLLDTASTMALVTQSMDVSDYWERNEPQQINQEAFWSWYDKEYSELTIKLVVKEGLLTSVVFSDCAYHFSNDIILTFELETIIEPTPVSDTDNSRQAVSLGDYQDRVDSKRERLEDRAEKAAKQSSSYFYASSSRANMIPLGQPILIGHHSEKRARREADRIFNDMGKSVEASKKADYLANRAQSVGKNGIASDDPEAVQKLKLKLEGLETLQALMKSVNKVLRSKTMSNEEKVTLIFSTYSLTQSQLKRVFELTHYGYVGFASYTLTNNNATIRTIKKRIEEVTILHSQQALEGKGEVEGLEWSLYEEDGRIKFSFDGKPSEELRATIKNHGFQWSHHSTAWVRKITSNGIASAERLRETLINV